MSKRFNLLNVFIFIILVMTVLFVTKKTSNQNEVSYLTVTYDCIHKNAEKLASNSFKRKNSTRFIREENILYVHGYIQDNILDQLKKHSTNLIVLSSLGGNFNSALKIAKYIRANNISTYIYPEAICASSCAILWAAGTHRAMGLHSSLIFHNPRISSLCLFVNNLSKIHKGDFSKISKILNYLKLESERLDNMGNLLLLDFLGVDFLDWYLSNRKDVFNKKTRNNLMKKSDVYLEASTAFKKGFSHEITGSIYENYTYVKNFKVSIRLPSYKLPDVYF